MDSYYFNGYSNVPDWITIAGIQNTNSILWHTFAEKCWTYKELTKTPKWKEADYIFLLGQEGNISDWVDLDSRIYVWDSLVLPNKEKFFSYFWWWWQTLEVNRYQKLTDKLTDPTKNKPYYIFECLMGGTRLHRDFLYKAINNDAIVKNNCLCKYNQNSWIPGTDEDIENKLEKLELAKNFLTSKSGYLMPYDGEKTANISTWIPWQIYNKSWFSIVTETKPYQNFFTEKTAKVLMSKKLFLYIGAQGGLRDLKKLGFKTFDSVIDESYDTEPNDQKRWNMAFEQIRYLCSVSPEKIYEKVLPILEHNQKTILEYDPIGDVMVEIRKILKLPVGKNEKYNELFYRNTPPWGQD